MLARSGLVIDRSEGEHGDEEEHKQLQRRSDTVGDEVADAHKDLACNHDSVNNRRQAL